MLDSDEYDFSPSSSSQLSSLFDKEETYNSNDLIYKAPKQPKPKKHVREDDRFKDKTKPCILFATSISLWRREGDKNFSSGRHGIAVISDQTQNIFELIVYKEKNNITARQQLCENFTWYSFPDCFGGFYYGQYFFVLKFDTNVDADKFLEFIAKYCSVRQSMEKPYENNFRQGNNERVETNISNNFESATKADILTRITRMGQQILPQSSVKGTSSDLTDSDEGNVRKQRTIQRKLKKHDVSSDIQISSTAGVKNSSNNAMVSQSNVPGQYFHKPVVSHSFLNTVNYNPLTYQDGISSLLLAQNAELNANLLSLSSKLDNLTTINNNENNSTLKSKVKVLELQVENLKSELEKTRNYSSELELKCIEFQNILMDSNHSEAKKVTERTEIKNLTEELELTKAKLKQLHDLQLKHEELKIELRNKDDELQNLAQKIKNCNDLESEIQTLKETISSSHKKIKQYGDDNKAEATETRKIDDFSETIREAMFTMYHEFVNEFEDNAHYSMKDIKRKLASHIRKTILPVINSAKTESM